MRVFRYDKIGFLSNDQIIFSIRKELNKKILESPNIRAVEISAYVVDNDIRPEYDRKKRKYIGDVYIDQLTDSESLSNELIERKLRDVARYLTNEPSMSLVGFFVTNNSLFDGWCYIDIVICSRSIPNFHRL